MASRRGCCRIGTSGFQYDHWRGRFYPEDVAKHEWLAYFNNDEAAHAVEDARNLRRYVEHAAG